MNLIVYGSLIHPAEFSGLAPREAFPVWVSGFRRAFDQRPMWRGDGRSNHTVLAVRPDPEARFNGVLLAGIASEHVATLDYRERGYIRTTIPEHHVTLFDPEKHPELPAAAGCYELYVGRPELRTSPCAPLADYHALCRQACMSWGRAFASAFEVTTEH